MTCSRRGCPASRKRASSAVRTDSATRRYVFPESTTVAWSRTCAAASAALTKAAMPTPLRLRVSGFAVTESPDPRLAIRERVAERDQLALVVHPDLGARPVGHPEGGLEEHERFQSVPRDETRDPSRLGFQRVVLDQHIDETDLLRLGRVDALPRIEEVGGHAAANEARKVLRPAGTRNPAER